MSARDTREVSEEERRYLDGGDPAPLDIVRICISGPLPMRHQQENHVIDDNYYWVKEGEVSWDQLQEAVEDPGPRLWINGFSTSQGINDQVPDAQLEGLNRSLYLVRPNDLKLITATERNDYGTRRRVRAQFEWRGVTYRLVVTDARIERQCLAQADCERRIENAVLCVSLADTFHGNAYKLAAAVIIGPAR